MDMRVGLAGHYDGIRPTYSLPSQIGSFSINSDGKYCNDNHQMKYLAMPTKLIGLNFDLNDGYSDYIDKHEDSEDDFLALLKWILSDREIFRKHFTNAINQKTDFVLYRGLLTALASTIYEKQDDWMVYATKYRSVIYMSEVRTVHKCQVEEALGDKGRRCSTWGFKFEQYMTSDSSNSRPNTSAPVNENEKFYVVEKGRLDRHQLLFAAEMDAVDPNTGPGSSMLDYVELKTSRILTADKQKRNFLRFKLLKWYLQSYFAGVPRLICGFRDDEGIVREVESYNVRDMPKMAKGLWSASACLNFCSQFLKYVKDCGMRDDPRVVYKIYWEPQSDITCEELPVEYQLLPDWYIEGVTAF